MIMKKNYKKVSKIFSVVLSLFMIVSMIPSSTYYALASIDSYQNMFTIKVVDENNEPIKNATVLVDPTSGDVEDTWTQTTDTNGIVGFQDYTDDLLNQSDLAEIEYSISAEGYKSLKDVYQVKNTDDHIEVTMEKLLLEIPSDSYSIKGYSGAYDKQKHEVEVKADGYKVTYSEDGQVYTDDVPFIENAGKKNVFVKIEKEGYNSVIQEVILELTKIDRTDFKFENENPQDISYRESFTNVATSEQETAEVTYKSSNTGIATVNSDGVVTFVKAGTVTISATMAESTNYNKSEVSYNITGAKLPRTDFHFETSGPVTITYGENNNVYQNVADNQGDGDVYYEISEQSRYGEKVYDVATIDEVTGEVTIKTSGTIVVKAVVEGENLEDAQATYTLMINKANQEGFDFANKTPDNIEYGETYEDGIASGGQSEGKITYSVTEGTDVVEVDENGKLTTIGIGSAIITATKAADDKYNEATATYTITVTPATLKDFAFVSSEYNVYYGQKSLTLGVTNTGDSTGTVSYSITEGSEIATIDPATGVLTFITGKTGTIKVSATISEDDKYNSASCEAIVNVTRKEMTEDDVYTIEATQGENGWYKTSVKIKAKEGYSISDSEALDAQWNNTYEFNSEGTNEAKTLFFKDNKEEAISQAITFGPYNIDTEKPNSLSVEYSESVIEKILEGISFGFYKAKMNVDVLVNDVTSGLRRVEVDLGNGTDLKEFTSNDINNGKISFTIDPTYEGSLYVKAYDNAGWIAELAEEKVIVVDDKTPGVEISYDNNKAYNEKYYVGNRTVTVKINEKYIDFDKTTITALYKGKNQDEFVSLDIKQEDFVKESENEQVIYKLTKTFSEEGIYQFDIVCTDYSGNVYDSYEMDEFIIDNTEPKIQFSSTITNGGIYAGTKNLTITIDEETFKPELLEVDIKAVDGDDVAVDLSANNYEGTLKDSNNWLKTKDGYKAKIQFDEEGKYALKISYKDHVQNEVTGQLNFTIDKTKPVVNGIHFSKSFFVEILEKITFGYFKSNVTVNIDASDKMTEIDKIIYSYGSEEPKEITDLNNPSFEIDKDTNTSILIMVVDKAGNAEIYTDTINFDVKVTDQDNQEQVYTDTDFKVVLDKTAPILDVNLYEDNQKKDLEYYKGNVVVALSILEENFDKEGVNITVKKDGELMNENITFRPSNQDDKYNAKFFLTEEGEYSIEAVYTDKAGNVSEKFEKKFFIDKSTPKMTIKYDNNDVKNKHYYKYARKATFTLKDRWINKKAINLKVNGKKQSVNWKNGENEVTADLFLTQSKEYNIEFSYEDRAGNKKVVTDEFVIDMDIPTAEIYVQGNLYYSAEDTNIKEFSWIGYSPVEDSFDRAIFSKDKVTVTLKGKDTYLYKVDYFQSDEIIESLEEITDWNEIQLNKDGQYSYQIAPNGNNIIYLRVMDKAGNVKYISSYPLILENEKPVVQTTLPTVEIEVDETVVYNGDVKVKVKVTDPKIKDELYSGIRTVDWYIEGNSQSKMKNLFTSDGSNQLDEVNRSFIVKAKDGNNNNSVKIKVIAIDNAGNKTEKVKTIKIDTTKPTIGMRFDNNAVQNEKYYNAKRIGTISIQERNFSEKKTVIEVTRDGKKEVVKPNWTKVVNGSRNKDNRIYEANVEFANDGDYEVSVNTIDKAGNEAKAAYTTSFVIDKKQPDVHVTYSSSASALNGNFYKATRSGHITVTEHNLNTNNIEVLVTAKHENGAIATPSVGAWSKDGDEYHASIEFANDGDYTFDVKVTDKAGNVYDNYAIESFVIDKTVPEITISGIEDNSANSGIVTPSVTCTDTNFDMNQMTVTLTGANRGSVELLGAYSDETNGRTFSFDNFAEEQEIDDIYTLQATLSDKAGNTTTKNITFSVNRFGSTYSLSKDSLKMNHQYVQNASDVVIRETNTDEITSLKLTLFKNNEAITLKEGEDYAVQTSGGNGSWYLYTYTIFKDNFEDDGVYRINVHSEDAAGNITENTLETKNVSMQFGVDKEKPMIVSVNLENDTTYDQESLDAILSVSDNLLLDSVHVYLDDSEKPIKTWTEKELADIVATNGDFVTTIKGDSTSAHNLKVVALDAAGNEEMIEVTNFYVTTNDMVVFYNNKPLFFGLIGLILAIIAFVIYFFMKKNKDKEEATN